MEIDTMDPILRSSSLEDRLEMTPAQRHEAALVRVLESPPGLPQFAAAVTEALEIVGTTIMKRVIALERDLADLKVRPPTAAVKYFGIHTPGHAYPEGALCTRAGGLWVATEPTTDVPGHADAWQLIVKRGHA